MKNIANADRPKDRKSTRLNSSHLYISYAVFCLKKKNGTIRTSMPESVQYRVRNFNCRVPGKTCYSTHALKFLPCSFSCRMPSPCKRVPSLSTFLSNVNRLFALSVALFCSLFLKTLSRNTFSIASANSSGEEDGKYKPQSPTTSLTAPTSRTITQAPHPIDSRIATPKPS